MTVDRHSGSRQATVAAITVTGLALFPVLLLGAMAADVQADLRFGAAAFGGAVAIFQGLSAAISIPAGVFVERRGWHAGALATIALYAVAMGGIAILTAGWWTLIVWLSVAAVASGLSSPTANLGLARQVRPERQGLAFGIKQAAVPAGTLMAGLAVPAIALTVGWRWAFAIGAVAALPLVLVLPRRSVSARSRERTRLTSRPDLIAPLLLLAAGAGLGTAATNSVAAFFVLSAVAHGVPVGVAGVMLATGGATSIVARILVGWHADRRRRGRFLMVAAMMAAGALGVAALGFVQGRASLALATLVAFGLGWSWNGLYDFSLVRQMSMAPATATGVAQTGKYLGGVAGPLAFGIIVEQLGYRPAWGGAGAALLVAAGTIVLARQRLRAVLATGATPSGVSR